MYRALFFGILAFDTALATAGYVQIIDAETGRALDSVKCTQTEYSRFIDLRKIVGVLDGFIKTADNNCLRVELPLGELTFIDGSPFAQTPDGIRQLTLPVVKREGDWFAEETAIASLLNSYIGGSMVCQPQPRCIVVTEPKFDLFGLRWSADSRRTQVVIPAARLVQCQWEKTIDGGVIMRFPGASLDTTRWRPGPGKAGVKWIQTQCDKARAVVVIQPDSGVAFDRVDILSNPPRYIASFTKEHPANFSSSSRLQLSAKIDSAASSKLAADKERWALDVVVIDPGHGGKDPGAVGPTKLKEKDVVLDIGLRLVKALREKGVKVIMTRDDDTFIPLAERTRIANHSNGKLFVSLHCNASKNRKLAGMETFFLSPAKTERAMEVALLENEVIRFEESRDKYQDITEENFILLTMAQANFTRESQDLAASIQRKVPVKIGLRDLGVDQAGFYVLVGASMPAILVEMGFISNKTEEKKLKNKAYRQKIAENLCAIIVEFLKGG